MIKARLGYAASVAALLSSLASPLAAQQAVTYTYDSLGRVLTVSYPNHTTTTYTYDKAGNRTGVSTASANHPPVAVADTVNGVTAGTPVTINVLGNDSDPDSDPLTIQSVTNGAKGTTQIVSNQVVYTSASGSTGSDTFNYTIIDNYGGQASAGVTVNFAGQVPNGCTVTPNPQITYNTAKSFALCFSGGTPTSSAYGATRPQHGSVTFNATTATYSPNSGYTGSDSFTFTGSNSTGTGSEGSVNLSVNPPPAPTTSTASATVTSGSYVTFPLSISGYFSTAQVSTQGTKGTASITVSGSTATAKYTANAGIGSTTTDTFQYTATGPGGTSSPPSTVTMTINPAAPALTCALSSTTYTRRHTLSGGWSTVNNLTCTASGGSGGGYTYSWKPASNSDPAVTATAPSSSSTGFIAPTTSSSDTTYYGYFYCEVKDSANNVYDSAVVKVTINIFTSI